MLKATKPVRCSTHRSAGFTLIELAVVTVIAGLIMVAAISAYQQYRVKKQVETTNENVTEANKAIASFANRYGFLPCPANPADPTAAATDCSVDLPTDVNIGALSMRMGTLPASADIDFSALAEDMRKVVAGGDALDGYGNRLAYTVIKEMTTPAGYTANVGSPDGMTITRLNAAGAAAGNVATDAKFIVFSHGRDGRGAFTAMGTPRAACDITSIDGQNCDGDAVFVSDGAAYRSEVGGAANYDDVLSSKLLLVRTCPPGLYMKGIKIDETPDCEDPFAPPTGAIDCPSNEALTGIDPMGAPVCESVSGSCPAGQVLATLVIGTSATCVNNSVGSCAVGQVQRGYDASGNPVCLNIVNDCGAGFVQVGTNPDHTPICAPNNKTLCPSGEVQIGNNPDGSANCKDLSNACPPGQFVKGMSGTSPICSNDKTIPDGTCPAGQIVTGISGGAIRCGPVPTTGGASCDTNVTFDAALSSYFITYYGGVHGNILTGGHPLRPIPHGTFFVHSGPCERRILQCNNGRLLRFDGSEYMPDDAATIQADTACASPYTGSEGGFD